MCAALDRCQSSRSTLRSTPTLQAVSRYWCAIRVVADVSVSVCLVSIAPCAAGYRGWAFLVSWYECNSLLPHGSSPYSHPFSLSHSTLEPVLLPSPAPSSSFRCTPCRPVSCSRMASPLKDSKVVISSPLPFPPLSSPPLRPASLPCSPPFHTHRLLASQSPLCLASRVLAASRVLVYCFNAWYIQMHVRASVCLERTRAHTHIVCVRRCVARESAPVTAPCVCRCDETR